MEQRGVFFSILQLWKDVSNCWRSHGSSRAALAGYGIMESHNHWGWNRAPTLWSPTMLPALPMPPLTHVPKCNIQGWRLQHCPGLDSSYHEGIFPLSNLNIPWCSLRLWCHGRAVPSHPLCPVEEEQEAAVKDTQLCQWQRGKSWDVGWDGGCRAQGRITGTQMIVKVPSSPDHSMIFLGGIWSKWTPWIWKLRMGSDLARAASAGRSSSAPWRDMEYSLLSPPDTDYNKYHPKSRKCPSWGAAACLENSRTRNITCSWGKTTLLWTHFAGSGLWISSLVLLGWWEAMSPTRAELWNVPAPAECLCPIVLATSNVPFHASSSGVFMILSHGVTPQPSDTQDSTSLPAASSSFHANCSPKLGDALGAQKHFQQCH